MAPNTIEVWAKKSAATEDGHTPDYRVRDRFGGALRRQIAESGQNASRRFRAAPQSATRYGGAGLGDAVFSPATGGLGCSKLPAQSATHPSQTAVGAKRRYEPQTPTPEQSRQDDSIG